MSPRRTGMILQTKIVIMMTIMAMRNKLMIRRVDSGMWQFSSSPPCGHWLIVSHLAKKCWYWVLSTITTMRSWWWWVTSTWSPSWGRTCRIRSPSWCWGTGFCRCDDVLLRRSLSPCIAARNLLHLYHLRIAGNYRRGTSSPHRSSSSPTPHLWLCTSDHLHSQWQGARIKIFQFDS